MSRHWRNVESSDEFVLPVPVFGVAVALRGQIHLAFDQVAMSLSCSFPSLLEATRARGLDDDDVRHAQAVDETEAASGVYSHMHLLCYRSNAGELYVTRDSAVPNQRASAFEGFVELWSASSALGARPPAADSTPATQTRRGACGLADGSAAVRPGGLRSG